MPKKFKKLKVFNWVFVKNMSFELIFHLLTKQAQENINKTKKPKKEFLPVSVVEKPADRNILVDIIIAYIKREVLVRVGGVKVTWVKIALNDRDKTRHLLLQLLTCYELIFRLYNARLSIWFNNWSWRSLRCKNECFCLSHICFIASVMLRPTQAEGEFQNVLTFLLI